MHTLSLSRPTVSTLPLPSVDRICTTVRSRYLCNSFASPFFTFHCCFALFILCCLTYSFLGSQVTNKRTNQPHMGRAAVAGRGRGGRGAFYSPRAWLSHISSHRMCDRSRARRVPGRVHGSISLHALHALHPPRTRPRTVRYESLFVPSGCLTLASICYSGYAPY